MKLTNFAASVLLAGGIASCSSEPSFHESTKFSKQTNQSESTDATSLEEPEEQLVEVLVPEDQPMYLVKIETVDTIEEIIDPVEIIFVLDNSQSMQDNIAKLRDSTEKLFDNLDNARIPFNARVLTLDLFLDQLHQLGDLDAIAPPNMSNMNRTDYNRGFLDSVYGAVTRFDRSTSRNALIDKLTDVAENSDLIENEPGLCLAMDYISWLSSNAAFPKLEKLNSNHKLHVILLSDEDNSRSIVSFDHDTGEKISEQDLICYRDKEASQSCETVETKTDQYCYEAEEEYEANIYNYKGEYTQRGICQKLGYADEGEVDTLERLATDQWCVKSTPRKYCEEVQRSTKYRCEAGDNQVLVDHDWSISGNNQNQRCEVAQNFECVQHFDGQQIWFDFARDKALKLMQRGVECRVHGDDPAWVLSDVRSSQVDQMGVRSCQVYQCASELHETSRRRVHILSSAFDPNRHENCSDTSPWVQYSAAYSIEYSSDQMLGTISQRSCPSGYALETTSRTHLLSNRAFCGNNLDQHLPFSGVSRVVLNESRNVTRNYDKNFSSVKGLNELASHFGVRLQDINVSQQSSLAQLNKRRVKLGCHDFQKFPPGHPEHNNWLQMIEEHEVKIETENRCSDPVVTDYTVASTPQGFLDHMKKMFPAQSLTWHSIVNITGKSCEGMAETNISKGNDYIDLSIKTDGVHQDICADDFDQFIDSVSHNVLTEKIISYALPNEFLEKGIEKVVNKSTGVELEFDKQYWVDDGLIVFEKSSIKKADEIEIIFSKGVKKGRVGS